MGGKGHFDFVAKRISWKVPDPAARRIFFENLQVIYIADALA